MPLFFDRNLPHRNASFMSIPTATFAQELSEESIILTQTLHAVMKISSGLPHLSNNVTVEEVQTLIKSSRSQGLKKISGRGCSTFRVAVTQRCIKHAEHESLAARAIINSVGNVLLAEDIQDLFRHGFDLATPGTTKGGVNPFGILIAHCILASPADTLTWINVLVDRVLTEVLRSFSNEMAFHQDRIGFGPSGPRIWSNPRIVARSPACSPSTSSESSWAGPSNTHKTRVIMRSGLIPASPSQKRIGMLTKSKLLHSPAATRSKHRTKIPRHSTLQRQGGKIAVWRQSTLFLADAKKRRASLRSQSHGNQADESLADEE